MTSKQFQKKIWQFYKKNRRDFPWRNTINPYKILVSEIMLQQTQAPRVVSKYNSFLKKFPTVKKLAEASLKEVLLEWQGLGYNRRAKYLKSTAEIIVRDYKGKFPKDLLELKKLPGIGQATAGDLLAFAWNIPVVVIETNIRSVFIHHFFSHTQEEKIHDKDILPLIEKTLDQKNPREWYFALMDYGAFLKEKENPGRRSKHYIKQSAFKGSNREKRSTILKLILEKPRTENELNAITKYDNELVESVLVSLTREKLISKNRDRYLIN